MQDQSLIAPARELPIGVVGSGVVHAYDAAIDIETRFRMVREAGVFDYYDRTPLPGELDAYLRGSAASGIPIRAGGFYYFLGRDEPLLEWHLRIGKELGARAHNVQIITHDATGQPVTDEQVVDALSARRRGGRGDRRHALLRGAREHVVGALRPRRQGRARWSRRAASSST